MISSDLPSPAEASGHWNDLSQGFAQAGNRCTLFRIILSLPALTLAVGFYRGFKLLAEL